MAAFPTPPGTVIAPGTLLVGNPTVLVARPDAQYSYLFTDPKGFLPTTPTTTGVDMPTTGQIWPTGWLTPTTALNTRTTTVLTTASLAANAGESGLVTLAKAYRVMSLSTSRPARVRLYTTSAKRDADVSRPVGTDPTGDHGLVLEMVTTASVLSADLSPTVDGFDGKATPDGVVPYHVTNLDSATGTVQVVFAWIRTE